MNNFSLNKDLNLLVAIRFIRKGNDIPLTGDSYRVRLYDKDIFEDDFLGESKLDNEGKAHISFTNASFGNFANVEETPDLYFILLNDDNIVFTSKVMKDVNLKLLEQFKTNQGEAIDLGNFLVDA